MSLIHLTKDSVPEYLRNNDTFGEEKSDAEFPSLLRPKEVAVRDGMGKRSKRSREKQP